MHPTAPSTETILTALRVTGFDYTSNLWWREVEPDGENRALHVFVPCSDFFAWGCADMEEITDDNIASLVATVAECEEIVGRWNADDAFLLWCARQRQTRPQGAYYEHLDQPLWHLFDAAGPARTTGFGNPKPRPTEETQ